MGIEAAATNERTVTGLEYLFEGPSSCGEHFPFLPSKPQDSPQTKEQKKTFPPDLLEYFQEEITLPWLEYCITKNLADLTS
jgi:hypothetical protein